MTAAAFPFLFGVAVGAVVWDLFVYSAIYLVLAVFRDATGASPFIGEE